MFADLDTLLTALYVELTDRIIPLRGFTRSGPGQPPEVTDAELVCIAVAQVLLRYDDERHWLRARKDETTPRPFPNWLRQRIEAIIWTLKNQLGLERHGGRVPAGCGHASSSGYSPSTPRSGITGS